MRDGERAMGSRVALRSGWGAAEAGLALWGWSDYGPAPAISPARRSTEVEPGIGYSIMPPTQTEHWYPEQGHV